MSVLVYRKLTHPDQYLHYGFYHQTSCKESVFSSLLNRSNSIITNKNDLNKENTWIKQVLKGNWYHKSIISKILKRITNDLSLSKSLQPPQATNIQEDEIRRVYVPLSCTSRLLVENLELYSESTN